MFVSISQVIGCEDRLRNDLYCVEWGVKLYSIHPYMRCLMTAVILEEHFSIICFCFLWLGIGRRIYSIVARYALSLVRYLFTASQKRFLDILSLTWPSIVPFQYFLADILGIKQSKMVNLPLHFLDVSMLLCRTRNTLRNTLLCGALLHSTMQSPLDSSILLIC